ncbi:MAG: M14 family metallocarboxypeptidase [Verrucomicrobiota bacterium]
MLHHSTIMAYTGEALDLDSFFQRWEKLNLTSLERGHFGQEFGLELPVGIKKPTGSSAYLLLTSGIHGDEPAGPLGLLHWLERTKVSPALGLVIMPLLNPEGMVQKAREHPDFGDLNRDYFDQKAPHVRAQCRYLKELGQGYDVAVCLHEDWESKGFYLYESYNGEPPGYARVILDAAKPHCGIDTSEVIEGNEADMGLLTRKRSEVELEEIGGCPEALYLCDHVTDISYTFEAPSAQPMDKRVAAHAAALDVIAQAVLKR